MSSIYKSNAETIGNSPLVQIKNLPAGFKGKILAKIEGRNPAFSVKCRVGANLIWDAEKRGVLNTDTTIVEPTSGNTGIALAFVAATKGYKLILTMPETMSIERRKVLAALGAEIILTPGPEGMSGAIRKAEEIASSDPIKYFLPQQFSNPANPAIHEQTTGPEIWKDTDGEIDILISGVGTGGTISGISRYIKETQKKAIQSIAVEPAESPVISQKLAGQELQPGPHKIQGIGAGFIPANLDLSLIDSVIQISSDEAMAHTRLLAQKEGILAGISSGAALAAAYKAAQDPANQAKTIVVILPDLGERYLSTPVFDN